MLCRKEGKEIPFDEIVKGYEYQKGDYVILTDEDFKKANVRATKTIDIQDFVAEDEINSMYYEKPYYLEPDKGASKPYALLHKALCKSNKVGIAKFVIRNREHLGAIKPVGGVIVLNQLRFEHEIRKPTGLDLPDTKKTDTREVEMALKLIEQLTEHFKPQQFKDTYTEELEKVIEAKAKGKKITAKGAAPKPTQVNDLMATLRKSLEKTKA
jgi:DNA end-binding protein Ku